MSKHGLLYRALRRMSVIAALAFFSNPTQAAVHALVYGFNEYPGIRHPLRGAVADADDLSGALRRRGIADVVERTAPSTRIAEFHSDWAAAVARAKRGDIIIFTFAGHGIRIAEKRRPRRTPDGFDKGFLLPSFDEDAHPDELLRDEDLYDLFKSTAAAKHLRILFIADACHAGTSLRDVSSPFSGSLRVYIPKDRPAAAAPVDPPKTPIVPRPPIADVAAIGAQVAELTVPEVTIDGKQRGALSYAVARAIDGKGVETSAAGALTVDSLFSYIRSIVRERSDNQQAPILFARDEDGGMPILADSKTESSATASLPELPTVSVFTGSTSVLGLTTVDDPHKSDLIWDPQSRRVSEPSGDTLVYGVNAAHLASAVEARRLLLFLRKVSEQRGPLGVSMHKQGAPAGTVDDHFQIRGTRLQFESAASPLPFVTVFDLNSDGTVQFLAPRHFDTPDIAAHPQFVVQPPFGADFAVFIRSREPLAELSAFFDKRGDEALATEVYEPLSHDLRDNDVRVGIQGLFTCDHLTANGQCDNRSVH